MKTIYDLVSLVLFAGLAILYLQRSASRLTDPIAVWKYGVAAIGCAVADYLGNHDQPIIAIILFVALLGYFVLVLKPFKREPQQ